MHLPRDDRRGQSGLNCLAQEGVGERRPIGGSTRLQAERRSPGIDRVFATPRRAADHGQRRTLGIQAAKSLVFVGSPALRRVNVA